MGNRFSSTPLADRLWDRIEAGEMDDCWPWTGWRDALGYGYIGEGGRGGRTLAVHRVAYQLHTGPIPDGLELDHLCRNPACCNPGHLEAVTHRTNIQRSAPATKPTCKRGHPYVGANLYLDPRGRRRCRACRALLRGRA